MCVNALETVSDNSYSWHNVYFFFLCMIALDVLKFDNTFSWTRSKKVHYSVKMLPPEGDGTTPTDEEATPTCSVEQNSVDNSSAVTQESS